LLDDERAAGAHISLRSDLDDLDALPTSVGRSAYRIVQEGLTRFEHGLTPDGEFHLQAWLAWDR
jgi:hypothetical protein